MGLLARRHDVHGGRHGLGEFAPCCCRATASLQIHAGRHRRRDAPRSPTALGTRPAARPAGTVDHDAPTAAPTAFSTATDTASLTVTSVNTAPVLTPASPSLGKHHRHHVPTPSALSSLHQHTARARQPLPTSISGAVVGGIAVTGTTGSGTWAYSLDGTTFTSVGTVSREFGPAAAQHRRAAIHARTARQPKRPRSPTAPGTRPPARAGAPPTPRPTAAPRPSAPPPTPPR